MKNLWLICMMVLGAVAASAGQGFEMPDFPEGQIVEEIRGWSANGASVSLEQASEGSQSLAVQGDQWVSKRVESEQGVRFYDLYVLPVFGAGEPLLKVAGAQIGFKKEGSIGKFVVFDGTKRSEIEQTNYPLTADSNIGEAWVRITLRVDHSKGNWDLYIDGLPVCADAKLVKNDAIELHGSDLGAAYLDQVSEGPENFLFVDSDRDGIPDAEEVAYGLDPHLNDRNGDIDGDGMSNAREFFSGRNPRISEGQDRTGAVYVYVDNLHGSDSNSGRKSYAAVGGDGPKASIKEAMGAAPVGASIIVLKGSGQYVEGSRGSSGKSLTIRTVEPIVIK